MAVNQTRFAFTVDDVALKDFSSVEDLRELLGFLKKEGVPATFFVVPFNQDIPLYQREDWVAALKDAALAGHELQLHGYRHEAFEWGIPPEFILAYEDRERRRLQEERAEIEKGFSPDVLTAKLEKGIAIFTRVAGHRPIGFRAPYGSTHPNLFTALVKCGFQYDSSLIINPKGWKYIVKDYTPGMIWDKNITPRPFKHQAGLIEIPIMAEYTWFLKEADVERHYQLIREDFDKAAETGGVMASVCHVTPVTGVNSAGLKVYEKLFRYAREQGNVTFSTLGECLKID
ncbi:MAG: DUF2334 domain-containing protein [Candidatus Omnitrophota bacterium]